MRYSFFFVGFSFFVLASCSLPGTQSEGNPSVASENTIIYDSEKVSILLPKSWTGVKLTDIPSPRVGSIIAAYKSTDVKYGFSNNIIIMQDRLSNLMTSAKYSELNNLQTTRNYLEYTKLREEIITFTDAETSRLYVFEARYNETTPRMKYIQLARVCGSDVYLLHVSLTLDKSPDNYIELLRTFRCK